MDTQQQRNVQLRRLLSPLHTLTDRDGQKVIRIIESGADVNTPKADGAYRGWSPLQLVVNNTGVSDAHVQIVERLLAAGAEPNKIVEDGDNYYAGLAPLHLLLVASARYPHDAWARMLDVLLTAGADRNMPVQGGEFAGLAPLHLLLVVSDRYPHDAWARMLDVLLTAGADPNMRVQSGEFAGLAPLHLLLVVSARYPHDAWPRMLDVLLTAGADPNMRVQGGEYYAGLAPLHIVLVESARSPNDAWARMLDVLLTAGAEANMPIQGGRLADLAPLHFLILASARSPHDAWARMLDILLKAGADPNMRVQSGAVGDTPLRMALRRNLMNLVPILLRYGALIEDLEQSERSKLILEGNLSLLTEEQLAGNIQPTVPSASPEDLVASAVKMIMLGDVRAGKTSIVKTLEQNRPQLMDDGEDARTIGVEITKMQLDSQGLTVYDFGGHQSYTSTHQLFCSPRSLYLIVADLSTFTPANSYVQFDHWYLSVTQRVIKAVFIVVGSKMDQCEDREAKTASIIKHIKKLETSAVNSLKRGMKTLENHGGKSQLSLLQRKHQNERIQFLLENRPIIPDNIVCTNVGNVECMQALVSMIKQTIANQSKHLPLQKIPKSWDIVEKQLLSNNSPYLVKRDFNDICEKGNITGDEKTMFLNHEVVVGAVLNFGEAVQSLDLRRPSQTKHENPDDQKTLKLSDIVFIKPEWIMEIIGCILNHRLFKDNPDHPLLISMTPPERDDVESLLLEGILSKSTLDLLLQQFDLESVFGLILKMLENFSICYKMPPRSVGNKKEDHYCFPGLLNQQKPDIESWWPSDCPTILSETVVLVYYNTDRSPIGFFEQISVKSNTLIRTRRNWKSGLVGKLHEEGSSLLMELKVINGTECLLIALRAPKEQESVTRGTIMSVIMSARYTTMNYPAVVFSMHVPCQTCLKESETKPAQTMQLWSVDDFISSDVKNVLLSCRNNHPDVHVREMFPIQDAIVGLCHRFVIPSIGEDWRFLARALFPSINKAENAISAYEHSKHNLKEKSRRVITRWQQECGEEASFPVMLSALNHISRRDIIEKLNADEQNVNDAEGSVIDNAKNQESCIKAATKRAVIMMSMEMQKEQFRELYRNLKRIRDTDPRPENIDFEKVQTQLFQKVNAELHTLLKGNEVREKIHTLLLTWIRDGKGTTFIALISALESEEVKRSDIADKLRDVCQKYGVDLSAPADQQQRLAL